jgi:ABC-type branched-subunit amino acid transport system substrate-binding protein
MDRAGFKIPIGMIGVTKLLAAMVLFLWPAATPIHAFFSNGLSAAELRGQSIFRKGQGSSARPITAFVGETEIEAKLIPCSSCHGMDGRGRPEGSVVPPSIRWEDLIRQRRSAGGGRERAPYNDRLLARAITLGFDPSGNRLNAAMPHFALSQSEAKDLIAYIKALSRDYDPGLSDDSIRIGALLPPTGRYPGLSATIQSALTAYFAEVNKAGGVYGRRVDVLYRELPPEPEKAPAAYKDFLDKEQVFALLASFIAGFERQSAEIIEEQRVPLVGAWTLLPENKPSLNFPLFYLDSGLTGQSEALVDFALRNYAKNGEKLALVASDDVLSQAALGSVRVKLAGSPWAPAEEVRAPEDPLSANALVQALAAAHIKVLFLAMRETQLLQLLHAMKSSSWNPILLIPSALYMGAGGLQFSSGQLFLAVSSLPSDVTPDGWAEYKKLMSAYGLPTSHQASQLSALAEAKILTEGLKRAGRELSRERLLESLEGLYDFSTGFSRPVSFGPARRVGSTQFHIVTVDPANGRWIEVNRPQE